MARETNWVAVGAIAAVASVFVALLAYSVPRGTPPNLTPNPTQANSSTESSQNTPRTASTGPDPTTYTQPATKPAGCQEGLYAVNTYYQTVGSTPSSEADAAERALNEIGDAGGSNPTGNVGADLESLYNDFGMMTVDVTGENGTTAYAQDVARTSTDARQLEKDCNTG